MSSNPFIDVFDAEAHAAFEAAGLASSGAYTPPEPGAPPRPQRAYVNTARQALGEYGAVLSARDTIDFLLADGSLARDGIYVDAGGSYRLVDIDDTDAHDASLQRWVVRRG